MQHLSKNVTKTKYDEDAKLGLYLNNHAQGFVRICLFIVMLIALQSISKIKKSRMIVNVAPPSFYYKPKMNKIYMV
jgi:hypothetical protein